MHRLRSHALSLVLTAVFLLAALAAPDFADALEKKQILLLNSYHHNFNWNEEIFRGLTEVLRPRETGIILHVENMDTKRVEFNEHYEQQLKEVFEHKYSSVKLNLIMVTDNNAFEFMRRHHDSLFPTVPVVFCGVNFFHDDLLTGHPLFTGVTENVEAAGTLAWALKSHPNTRNIFVINDHTPTGKAMTRTIQEQLKGFDPSITLRFNDDLALPTILAQTEALPKDSLILLGAFYRDALGQFYDVAEVATALSHNAKVPVYGLGDSDLGHGIVGGMLTGGHMQGQSMAQLALHVLAGRPPAELPVIKETSFTPKFDYLQLKRFNISLDDLPEDSVIINRPKSFYSENLGLLVLGTGLAAIQSLIIIALFFNIIRRRRAERGLRSVHRTLEERVRERTRKLRDSEEALRTVFDSSHDAIIIHDNQGQILEANRRMVDMFGLNNTNPTGMSIFKGLASRDNPIYRTQAILRDVINGEPQNFEWRAKRISDGHEFDVEIYLTRISYHGQRAVLANIRDISVRKESENDIRQNLTKFEAILDNSLMGIAMTVGRKLVTINRRGAEIFGYTPAELTNNSLELLLGYYQTEEEFVTAAKKALRERGEFNSEQAFRSKNGSTVWCRMYAKTVDPDNLNKGIIWAWDDVTDSRRAQEDLLRTREDAEAANRAKSEFLAAMSHEIRTPMNAIVGMTDITLQTDLTDNQRDYLKTVKDSAQHLLSIINDILDLSKIEARKLELDCVDFDLPFHVRTTVKGLEIQARQKGLEMNLDIDENMPACVKGDPLSLRQVLVNLVGNAIKFTHKGYVTIRVRPVQQAAPQDKMGRTQGVYFEVEDTGIGIPRDFMGTLFQSFSQSTRAFGGTGLGLAICKQLIALMDGDIQVQSSVGKGSTFSFTIWFQPGTYSAIPVDTSRGLPDAPHRPIRILVAEDNDVNVMVTTLKLEDFGYSYAVAGTGLEVLDMLKREAFDLILMDIEMPVLDGISTTKAIRSAIPGGPIPDPNIPIIGVTAHALKEFRDTSLEAGMNDYVAKPVDFLELASCINRLIGAMPLPPDENKPATTPPEPTPPPADTAAVPTWTPDAAMEKLGVDKATFTDFLATARTELITMTEELYQAFNAEDFALSNERGHTLKSICVAIGANSAALAASAFVEACQGKGEPGTALGQLRTEVEYFLKIMDEKPESL